MRLNKEKAKSRFRCETKRFRLVLPVILMIVKEAGDLSPQRDCLLQIAGGMAQSKSSRWRGIGTVFQRMSTAAPRRSKSALLPRQEAVRLSGILPAFDRLIDMARHPFLVFGKGRVNLLKMAEFTHLVRRTRCVGRSALNSAALARYCSA